MNRWGTFLPWVSAFTSSLVPGTLRIVPATFQRVPVRAGSTTDSVSDPEVKVVNKLKPEPLEPRRKFEVD